MRTHVAALLVALALAFSLAPLAAHADRDIVFSAQWHKWSGKFYKDEDGSEPERMLTPGGTHHLYRINPDGTGLKRITSSKWDDYRPQWSPDGSKILFERRIAETWVLLVMDASSGSVRQVYPTPGSNEGFGEYQWSPDGRWISFSRGNDFGGASVLINVQTGAQYKIKYGVQLAWSPDSRRIFVVRTEDPATSKVRKPEVWNVSDAGLSHRVEVSRFIRNPVWLNNDKIMGDTLEPDGMRHDNFSPHGFILLVVSRTGEEVRKVRLRAVPRGVHYPPYIDYRVWLQLPTPSPTLIFETYCPSTGGRHPSCWLADLKSSTIRYLHEGYLVGASPDGKRCAVAEYEWVGPYKRRGGYQCGALSVVNLKTRKAKAITSKLVSIKGGDWRKSRD